MKNNKRDHKTGYKNFKKTEKIKSVYSEHNTVNLEIMSTSKLEEIPTYLEIKLHNN